MKLRVFRDKNDQLTDNPQTKGRRGWKSDASLDLISEHRGLQVQIIHVAVCDEERAMYDQPIIVEAQGGRTVVRNSRGEIKLIKVFRPTINTPSKVPEFQEAFRDGSRELGQFGKYSWETPRGFPTKGATPRQTADDEAAQETNSLMLWVHPVGAGVPNTTYFTTPQPVFLAQIDETFQGQIPPDINERILLGEWFSWDRIDIMIATGEIFCDMTISALHMVRIHEKMGLLPPVK